MLERSVVLVDDGSLRGVSTCRYICLPRKGDVRGVANVDMFMKVGGRPVHRVFRRRSEFPASIRRSLALCTPQSSHIGPGGGLKKSQSAVFATSPDSIVLSPWGGFWLFWGARLFAASLSFRLHLPTT
jgi:hypothetical protein